MHFSITFIRLFPCALLRWLAGVLLAGLALACHAQGLYVGAPLPPVEAVLPSGTLMRLPEPGKVTLLHFWASWCAPCREELPILQAYYARHHGQGLQMLAINLDDPRETMAARRMLRGLSFPAAWQAQVRFQSLGRIPRLPATHIIDRQGIVRRNGNVGSATLDMAALEALVTPLLTAP